MHNLVQEVERADATTLRVRGNAQGLGDDDDPLRSQLGDGARRQLTSNEAALYPANRLVAGTAWHFAARNSTARSTCSSSTRPDRSRWPTRSRGARRAQPRAARRSDAVRAGLARKPSVRTGARCSSTAWVKTPTIPPERGIFLAALVPHASGDLPVHLGAVYDGRLASVRRQRGRTPCRSPGCTGAGCAIAVEHEGNGARVEEEADAIVARSRCCRRHASRFAARRTAAHADDILVVTPYNAQRKTHRERLEPPDSPTFASERSTSSKDSKRRSSSIRWRPRAATTCRAGWSSL